MWERAHLIWYRKGALWNVHCWATFLSSVISRGLIGWVEYSWRVPPERSLLQGVSPTTCPPIMMAFPKDARSETIITFRESVKFQQLYLRSLAHRTETDRQKGTMESSSKIKECDSHSTSRDAIRSNVRRREAANWRLQLVDSMDSTPAHQGAGKWWTERNTQSCHVANACKRQPAAAKRLC